MKNSDNVVRLGLTPKHKDTDTLLKILDYSNRSIERLEKVGTTYRAGDLLLQEILTEETVELKVPSIGIVL
jgi:mannose-6-phosphate isomerase class I